MMIGETQVPGMPSTGKKALVDLTKHQQVKLLIEIIIKLLQYIERSTEH